MAHWKVRRGEAAVALAPAGRGGGRGDLPHAVPGARLHRAQRDDRASPDGAGGVVVYGSMQCPFYVQKAVASALGCELNQARIVQTVTGGGFGGKEDAPSAPGAQVALLAHATGRPVRLILTREEDMAVMSKRHPAASRMRTGATARRAPRRGRGRLPARRRRLRDALAGGAVPRHRARLRPLSRAQRQAWTRAWCAPTRCPAGAFRGFGEPQVVFAAESQMDLLAERLGIDPLELRRRNALRRRRRDDHRPSPHRERRLPRGARPGGASPSDWESKRAAFAADQRARCAEGIGLAACYYGVGLGPWAST